MCVCVRAHVCACAQWKKAEEKLEKELLEAEALENKDKKIKLVRMKDRVFLFVNQMSNVLLLLLFISTQRP